MSGYFQPPGQPFPAGTPLGYGPKGPSDDQLLALLAYLLTFVASLIAPLVIFLAKMNESRYVRFHAAQSLNMGITALIYSFGGFLIGIGAAIATHGLALILLVPLFIAFVIAHLIYLILAAVAASRGELYRVPSVLCLPLVR
jgi:uncharacterized Tic20 family protein